MKKLIAILLAMMMVFPFAGCGNEETAEQSGSTAETPKTEESFPEIVNPATVIDNEGNTIEITSDELIKINKENEAKFEKYYDGAKITFVGTVKSVEYGLLLHTSHIICDTIEFEEGWKVYLSHEQYYDLLVELSAGDKVEVQSNIYYAESLLIDIRGTNPNTGGYNEKTLKYTKLKLVE